ncbi:MAG: glycosyltransferase family 2 protein [Bacteroidales bacterium]|nr:glycosyltransferase family 2 protein [Bacteroidales bacterium]
MTPPRLAIVVPCYNEQEALPASLKTLLGLLNDMTAARAVADDSYIMCVDDGSRDRTWQIIAEAHNADRRVKGIALAHNRGHQNALLAGLEAVTDRCDISVSIDADLQDDPQAIRNMVGLYSDEHAEIVYGVRSSRESDSWFKRTSAQTFYRLQRALGVDTVYNHADYRLMSNRALHLLGEYGESNMYLRGIVPQIGLRTATVSYPRTARTAGETHYPLSKMISLSVDGITSFTAKPMRMIFTVGLILLVLDIIVAVWVLIAHFRHETITGWSSLMLSVWFLGSLILMGLGIVGEYIGKIYIEVKRRPRFAVREEIF